MLWANFENTGRYVVCVTMRICDAGWHVWLYLLSWIKMFFTDVSSPVFSFWGLVEITPTEGFIIGAYYSCYSPLRVFIFLFVWLCCLQISQESSRQSSGERKCKSSGFCGFLQPLRSNQGQMWLPALWALTFITCDVIKQKVFHSWATVRRQSPIIRKTFGFIS